MANLALPNQFPTTATTGGQPDDWNTPQISCTYKRTCYENEWQTTLDNISTDKNKRLCRTCQITTITPASCEPKITCSFSV